MLTLFAGKATSEITSPETNKKDKKDKKAEKLPGLFDDDNKKKKKWNECVDYL